MKYEYVTTIIHLNDYKATMIKVNPPDDTGWSLLGMVTSPNGLALYYNWAKQKPLNQFESSDSDFEKSIEIVKSSDQQESINKINDAIFKLEEVDKRLGNSQIDL